MQLLAARLGQKRLVPTLVRQLHTNPTAKSPHPATPPNPTTGISPQPLPPSLLSNYARKAVSPVAETFRAYGRAQRRRPWLVQVLTAVAVYTAGDLNAQLLFGNEDESFDLLRLGRNIFIGAIFAIPGYEWYFRISNMFTRYPTAIAIALRVGMNQLLFTPPFLVCFFAMQGAMSGLTASEIYEKVTTTVPTTFRDSCKLWPAVSAFNFWAVPLEFRPLFGGAVAVAWNAYLSFMNQKADKMIANEEAEPTPTATVPVSKGKKLEKPAGSDKEMSRKAATISRDDRSSKCEGAATATA